MKGCSVLFAAVLFLIPVGAAAQLKLQVHLGHQGFHGFRSWTPLQITLESGEKALRGLLKVSAPSGSVYVGSAHFAIHSRPVSIPPLSRETYNFSLFVDNISSPLKITFEQVDGLTVERSIDLREKLITGDFIIVLSRSPQFDFLQDRLGSEGRVVYPRLERLPTGAEGYHGVGIIIVHDADLSLLNRKQIQAIEGWAALGGRLILTGGPGRGMDRFFAYSSQPDGKVLSMVALDRLAELGDRYGAPLDLPDPIPLAPLKTINGKILAKEGDTPLIVLKKWGDGEVIYLAFDPVLPVFLRWRGFHALWNDLIEDAEPSRLDPALTFGGATDYITLRHVMVNFPPLWQVSIFVFSYLMVYISIRRIVKGKIAQLLAAAVMVGTFIILAHFFFYRTYLPNGYFKFQSSIVTVYPRTGIAYEMSQVVFFSSRKSVMTAEGLSADSVVKAYTPDSYRNRERDYRISYKTPSRLTLGAPLKPWTSRAFSILSPVTPPIKLQVSRSEDEAYIKLYNKGNHTIMDGRLIFGGNMFKLADFPAGTSLIVDISPEVRKRSWTNFALENAVEGPNPKIKMKMLKNFLSKIDKPASSDNSEAVFVGWLDEGLYSGLLLEKEHRAVTVKLVGARIDIQNRPERFSGGVK